MAATNKAQAKVRMEYSIDKQTYDDFVRMCTKKGFVASVVVEKMMKKYNESGGQI